MRYRRSAQCGQIHPVQCADQVGHCGGELSFLHHRAERRLSSTTYRTLKLFLDKTGTKSKQLFTAATSSQVTVYAPTYQSPKLVRSQ